MNYKIVKYSEIGKIRSGKRLPKGYTVSEKISDNKYIRVRDINSESIDSSIVQYITDEAAEKLERYKVKTRDVIISVVGTVGAIAQIDESLNGAYLTENCDNLQVDESLCLKDYLKYYLLSEDGSKEIIANTVGSTQPKLPIYGIENFNIKLPSIDNQKRIVKLLNSIDKKIKLNNEINNNLYKLIKNNYESLINGCNWEEVELGAISNITSGKRPVDKSETGEYPVIGANGIMAYACDYNFNEDLIITGRVGTLGVVKRYLGKIWASDNTLVIQTKYLNYIENYLKTVDYYSLNRGSTQPLLTQGDLKKQIIYFNEELVTKFEKDNQIFVDKIRNNEKENSKLIQLRDTLLPKLMNGEIDLDNIEI